MDEQEQVKKMTKQEQQACLNCEHDCSACAQGCTSKVKRPADTVIAVTGGKGGTGKSVVTVLFAKALMKRGLTVAILDADIACPSIPALLGMKEPVLGDMPVLTPVAGPGGISVVSMGIISDEPLEPVLWTGKYMAQVAAWLMRDTKWPEGLDVLLIDMPSGAGDIPLAYYTAMPLDYALAVVEPGELSSGAARRAVSLAEKLCVPVMGIVENFAEEDMNLPESCKGIPVVATISYNGALRRAACGGKLGGYETECLDDLARVINELR